MATVAKVENLTKVTAQPLIMSQVVATRCATFPPIPTQYTGPNAHAWKYFDIYASQNAADVVKTGQGTYPEGSVVLKRKYSDASGSTTELYTGMLKREKGYNPASGDWEYYVLSGDGKSVQRQGKLTECMACHATYSSSDYITRDYFTTPEMYDLVPGVPETQKNEPGSGFGRVTGN